MHMVEFIMCLTQRKAMLDKQFYWVITFGFFTFANKADSFPS